MTMPSPLDSVDPTRYSAGIVAHRGQPHSALIHDRAAVAIIGMSIGAVITGRQIKRAEARLYPVGLIGVLHPYVGGQMGENIPHMIAIAVADHFDEAVPVPGPVTLQFGYDGIESRMKGWLPAQDPNALPTLFSCQPLIHPLAKLSDIHMQRLGGLRAGAIAVKAAQIAQIGDVEFQQAPTASVLEAQQACEEGMNATVPVTGFQPVPKMPCPQEPFRKQWGAAETSGPWFGHPCAPSRISSWETPKKRHARSK